MNDPVFDIVLLQRIQEIDMENYIGLAIWNGVTWQHNLRPTFLISFYSNDRQLES